MTLNSSIIHRCHVWKATCIVRWSRYVRNLLTWSFFLFFNIFLPPFTKFWFYPCCIFFFDVGDSLGEGRWVCGSAWYAPPSPTPLSLTECGSNVSGEKRHDFVPTGCVGVPPTVLYEALQESLKIDESIKNHTVGFISFNLDKRQLIWIIVGTIRTNIIGTIWTFFDQGPSIFFLTRTYIIFFLHFFQAQLIFLRLSDDASYTASMNFFENKWEDLFHCLIY